MNFFKHFRIILFFFCSNAALAATYNLTSGSYPPCSTSWSVSGTTYTCTGNGRVTLASGDILTSSGTISIRANNGFVLNNNTIGSASASINLISNYGSITSTGTNTIYGNLEGTSADITLAGTSITGSVTTNGNINLTGGSITGVVTSNNNTITTNGTNLGGGASARSGMSLTGGTISGSFLMTANNVISLSGVTMTSGSISGASSVTIQSGSQLGSASSSITISSNSGAITVNNSVVYGSLTTPNYSTVNVTNGASVIGTCLPNSTPANACNSSPPVCTTGLIGGLSGAYFNNMNLTGSATATRIDTSVDFDWAAGSPGVSGVGSNQFSVRWTGRLRAPVTGNYRFQTVSDDGVRLWVNGQQVINNWTDHGVTTNTSSTISLDAGYAYDVRLEFYENGGQAVIQLLWSTPGTSSFSILGTASDANPSTANYCDLPSQTCRSGFSGNATAQYFNNVNLTGTAVATRQESVIDYDWSTGATGVTGVNSDNFSIRWDATLKVNATGNYQFQTLSDDGVRLWVNNQQVINNWTDHSVTTDTSTSVALTAGMTYPLRLEFYERGGYAVISLRWRRPEDSAFAPISACPASVSFYGISHSGTGLTCTAEPVTISAYDDTGALVAPDAGTIVSLSTLPATGTWTTASYSFTGTETSFVTYLRQLSVATLNINVTDGARNESASFDPAISFVDTGLKFYNASGGISPIANQRAGVTTSTPILKAVRTNTNTGACEARAVGTRNVNIGYECVNPTTCISGQTLSLASTSVTANNSGASINYTPVSLSFNANGEALIPFSYSDVGRIRLHASLPLAASGNDPAITLTGASDNFVVRPDRLSVSLISTPAGSANPGGTSVAGAAAGFVPAGSPFRVVVQSQNANAQPTPNFGRESPSENNLLLKPVALVHPAGGTLTALSNANSGSFTLASPAGSFENLNVTWNQVGSLTLRPELFDNDYLGAGAPTYVTSGTVGRFYPDRFAMTSQSVANSCVAFSYMSQPNIALSYQLQALSATGAVLTNYGAGYYNSNAPVISYQAENANAANGNLMSSRVIETLPKIWSSGIMSINTNASFARTNTPDGPYDQLHWGLTLNDTFDLRPLSGLNMNAGTSGTCSGPGCNAVQLTTTPLNLRFGRLRLEDAFGPETANLPVNFMTEYWTGAYWQQNNLDFCTAINRNAITYPQGSIATASNLNVPLSGGSTQGVYQNLGSTDVIFNAGNAGHYFTAPGSGTGSFNVGINLTNYPWLRYDWNQNGNHNDDVALPDANFGFGSYRGHDRIIYWREVF
jgi:MSHA biogenesis protein MshQ